jgi:hypothetical protein
MCKLSLEAEDRVQVDKFGSLNDGCVGTVVSGPNVNGYYLVSMDTDSASPGYRNYQRSDLLLLSGPDPDVVPDEPAEAPGETLEAVARSFGIDTPDELRAVLVAHYRALRNAA